MNQPVLEFCNVSFAYDTVPLISDLSLSIPKGKLCGLVGSNGSAKTTLIKLALGLLEPRKGEVRLFGQPVKRFRQWERIGYLGQKATAFNTGFPASVEEVVTSGLTGKLGIGRFVSKGQRQRVTETLEDVGLGDMIDRPVGQLSGGQQQRVFLARAIVHQPEFLLLDEPTTGIDEASRKALYSLLTRLHRRDKITALVVSHDLQFLTNSAHAMYTLVDGCVLRDLVPQT